MGSSANSKLCEAIARDDIDLARRAIDKGADVNQRGKNGRTPLTESVFVGHDKMVLFIIDKGADMNLHDRLGDGALHLTIKRGHVDLARELNNRGVEVNIKDWLGNSPLYLAIKGGHIDLARELINSGADINIKDRLEQPLHLAIDGGHVDLARELINRGADINIKDGLGDSPLHLAIKGGHIDLARELIDRGADINVKNVWGVSPLHLAIEGGHIDLPRELINRGADINIKDGVGHCPLHLTIKAGHIDLAWELIDRGADINMKDTLEEPLHLAIKGGHIDLAWELIDRGADINIKDGLGDSPLYLAIQGGHHDLARELIIRGADINIKNVREDSPLHLAIKGGHIDLAWELIDRGADINIKDTLEEPLHLAIQGGHIDLARELIDRGADINIKDRLVNMYSPLYLAIQGGHIDLARELIIRGADINVKNAWGVSTLHLAIEGGHIDLATELIGRGADISVKYLRGARPLHLAIQGGHIDLATELIGRGADINTKNGQDESPLHLAMKGGHTDLAKELINNRGADINIKDRLEDSPLHLATKGGHTDLAMELIGRGADINIKDGRRANPLHLAIEGGHIDLAKELIGRGADITFEPGDNPLQVQLAKDLFDRGADSNILFNNLVEGDIERLQLLKLIEPPVVSKLCSKGLLHTSLRLGYDDITKFLLSLEGRDVNATYILEQTPLHSAMEIGNEDIANKLSRAGCKEDALDGSERSVLHLSAIYGHTALMEDFIERGLDPNQVDCQGRTSLHYGVIFRQEDIVSLLLRKKALCEIKDDAGKIPRDYLHESEEDRAVFKELVQAPTGIEVFPLTNGDHVKVNPSRYDLGELSKHRGIGSVKNIRGFVMEDFIRIVKEKVKWVIRNALQSKGVKVVGCGSSFEGSKVGMPDELDFLVELFSIYQNRNKGTDGYGKMERDENAIFDLNIKGTYGVWLWDTLMTFWKENHGKDIGDGFRIDLPPQRHPDRKTCTTWIWLYSNDMFKDLPVSIDFVPAIKVERHSYREKSLRGTWMMTAGDIGGKHFYIVPKIPHENSAISKSYRPEDLNQLGRISYPTLEVEHMLRLDERLMDVFITVKSLRRPEVCGFKIRNESGKVVTVGEHLTSYRLKTVFLHLVELFLKSKMSLGKMVLMVYEHLEKCLVREELPSFFDPDINVLAGSRLNTKDSHVVAKMMTRMVRSTYERDFQSAVAKDAKEERRIIEESRKEYADSLVKISEYESDKLKYAEKYWENDRPFLPMYLEH